MVWKTFTYTKPNIVCFATTTSCFFVDISDFLNSVLSTIFFSSPLLSLYPTIIPGQHSHFCRRHWTRDWWLISRYQKSHFTEEGWISNNIFVKKCIIYGKVISTPTISNIYTPRVTTQPWPALLSPHLITGSNVPQQQQSPLVTLQTVTLIISQHRSA